ncbi:MAG: hypothetical protein COA38_01960 [Fluviicola sp.]|nr:MAG: hypothetical protein COA38_01960 [Fluviicola sp.]
MGIDQIIPYVILFQVDFLKKITSFEELTTYFMRKNSTKQLRLLVIVLITSLTSWQAKANESTPIDKISPCETVGEWTKMSQENDISISYSTITCNGETFLAIQFENTSETAQNFIWSIAQNGERLRITEDEMQEAILQIDSNGSSIYKGTYLISINDERDYSNFKVSIQTSQN